MMQSRNRPPRDPFEGLIHRKSDRETVERVLRTLPPHLADIICQRYGIGQRPVSFEAIAAQYAVPVERVERSVLAVIACLRAVAHEVAVSGKVDRTDPDDPAFRFARIAWTILMPGFMWKVGLCCACGWDLPDRRQSGRRRTYCSDACRKAWNRRSAQMEREAQESEDSIEDLEAPIPHVVLKTIGSSKLCLDPATGRCWAEIDVSTGDEELIAHQPLGELTNDIVRRFQVIHDKVTRRERQPLRRGDRF